MTKEAKLLIFEVDGIRCALPVECVIRVESAVAVTHLPNAPEIVAGVVNVRGQLLPVMDVRQRLNLPAQEMLPEDHLIISKSTRREMILWVGNVQGVESYPETDGTHVSEVLQKLPHLSGICAKQDDLLLIYDLEKFLSDDEDLKLSQALETVSS